MVRRVELIRPALVKEVRGVGVEFTCSLFEESGFFTGETL